MPYITFTVRATSDVGGEPAVVFDYTARLSLNQVAQIATQKASGDGPGVYYQIPGLGESAAVNALILRPDQLVNFKLDAIPSSAWLAGATYAVGNQVLDSNGNLQQCTTGGMAGGTNPSWATTIGGITHDGGAVIWVLVSLLQFNGGIPINAGGLLVVINGNIAAGATENTLVNNPGSNAANIAGLAGGS